MDVGIGVLQIGRGFGVGLERLLDELDDIGAAQSDLAASHENVTVDVPRRRGTPEGAAEQAAGFEGVGEGDRDIRVEDRLGVVEGLEPLDERLALDGVDAGRQHVGVDRGAEALADDAE